MTFTLQSRKSVLVLLVVAIVVVALLATTADAASGRRSAAGGPPRRMSLKRRQELAKQKAAEAVREEAYLEQKYREYQKLALPSPDDGKQMVPYTGGSTSAEESHIRSLSVGKLRSYLKEREATCQGCVEKLHLIERAMQVRGWETETERIVKELTPAQFSAENAMSPTVHIGGGANSAPLTDAHGNQLVATTTDKAQIEAIQLSHGIVCSEDLNNGTQYCHKVAADDSSSHYM